MNFSQLTTAFNLKALATSVIIDTYTQLLTRYKEHFSTSLEDCINTGSSVIVGGRVVYFGSDLQEFLNGDRDSVRTWVNSTVANVTDVDDMINDQFGIYDSYLAFFSSLKTNASSMSERLVQFKQDVASKNISGENAANLIEYLSGLIASSSDINSIVDQALSDIAPSSEQVSPLSSDTTAFNATGVNVCSLWVTSLDLPTVNVSQFASQFAKAVATAGNIAKGLIAKGVQKALSFAGNWINTKFIDTIDYEILPDYQDLSINQSCIYIGEEDYNTDVYTSNISSRLNHLYSVGVKTVNYAYPFIGATLYVSCTNLSSDGWNLKYYLKKHVYHPAFTYAVRLAINSYLTSPVVGGNIDMFMNSLFTAINNLPVLPQSAKTSSDEQAMYNALNDTSLLIPMGLKMATGTTDYTQFYSHMSSWYGNGTDVSKPAHQFCIWKTGSITNKDFYQAANAWPAANGSMLTMCHDAFNAGLSSEFSTEIDLNVGLSCATMVPTWYTGAFNIKSDDQLVSELKSTLLGIVAVAAVVALGAVALKVKLKANKNFISNLREYQAKLQDNSISEAEVVKSFKKMNRWSKIASKGLVSTAMQMPFSAPSYAKFGEKSNNELALDITNGFSENNTLINNTMTKVDDRYLDLAEAINTSEAYILHSVSTDLDSQLSSTTKSINDETAAKLSSTENSITQTVTNAISTSETNISNVIANNTAVLTSNIAVIDDALAAATLLLSNKISTEVISSTNEITADINALTVKVNEAKAAISILQSLIK